jgi:hypothetical protein
MNKKEISTIAKWIWHYGIDEQIKFSYDAANSINEDQAYYSKQAEFLIESMIQMDSLLNQAKQILNSN